MSRESQPAAEAESVDTGEPPSHATTPPSHDGLPVIGNTLEAARDQEAFYEAAAEEGDVVHLQLLGFGDLYQINHPDLVREVLVTSHDRYGKASMTQDQLGELLGQGLVLSEGELWQSQRQRIQPAFYREKIGTYAETMTEETAAVADEWTDGDVVGIEDEMKALTLRILVKSIFGSELDYDDRGIRQTVQQLQEPGQPSKQPVAQTIPKWVPIPMWRRYREGIAEMESVIEEFVDQRRGATEGRTDLLSRLLRATDDDGEGMSAKLLRDELMTFLFAGHETTATALTFAWYALARNPSVERRLAAELTTTLDGPATVADLPRLPYTEAVLLESMRLYPPVPSIPREPAIETGSTTLGGYRIPADGTVTCSQWVIHRDERWWDDPSEFRPARWLPEGVDPEQIGSGANENDDGHQTPDSDDSASTAGVEGGRPTPGRVDGTDARGERPAFAYFPFGGGPRRCVGEQFALVEGQLLLATLLRRYEPTLESDPDVDLSVSITTRPVDPIDVRLAERS
mgnify:CR=1 FL=1